jgi:predicted nucleic acid-binding protein
MPSRTRLLDTSVAVALVVADHEHHAEVRRSVGGGRLGLAGHALFETYSVLTRLPAPARRTPAAVVRLLAASFPDSRFLPPDVAAGLLADLPGAGVAGGSVYDALVGAVAAHHRLILLTRDRRAIDTYRAIDAPYEVIA